MFKRTNLKSELDKLKVKELGGPSDYLLSEAYELLYKEYCKEKDTRTRLKSLSNEAVSPPPRVLDFKRMYSEEAIRQLAIKYRLRFLEASHFKPLIPAQAISSLHQLEREANLEFKSVYILAPTELFDLKHCEEDPIMFVKIGLRTWYLVDQWGGDLHWSRSLIFFPLRNKACFTISVMMMGFLAASLFPVHQIVSNYAGADLSAHLSLFLWINLCISSLIAYFGFAFFRELSADQWNSAYLRESF